LAGDDRPPNAVEADRVAFGPAICAELEVAHPEEAAHGPDDSARSRSFQPEHLGLRGLVVERGAARSETNEEVRRGGRQGNRHGDLVEALPIQHLSQRLPSQAIHADKLATSTGHAQKRHEELAVGRDVHAGVVVYLAFGDNKILLACNRRWQSKLRWNSA